MRAAQAKVLEAALRFVLVVNVLAAQRLGLCPVTAKVPGVIPGQGTKVPQALLLAQNRKNTVPFYIDLKNGEFYVHELYNNLKISV